MFSCEHSEIFKNIYFDEHLRTAASESSGIGALTFMKHRSSRISGLAARLVKPSGTASLTVVAQPVKDG